MTGSEKCVFENLTFDTIQTITNKLKRRVTKYHKRVVMSPYPLSVIASLVTFIFFTHPKHNSSKVHSSVFSVGGGFTNPVELENIIGVELFRLALRENEAGNVVEVASAPPLVRLTLRENDFGAA